MNIEEIVKLKKKALYTSLKSPDIFGKFFNKSILHNAVVMEIFSNSSNGISYEKLCLSIPKSIGSRSSIQNLLNEGLDKKIFKKIESQKDKRIKNYYLSESFSRMVVSWVKDLKKIFSIYD